MNILVTGGAGFIGSHIVDAYIALGHRVIIVDNLSTGQKQNISSQATFYEMDIQDARISEIISDEKIDCINHHAAQIDVRKSVENPVEDVAINVGGTINLLIAAQKTNVKRFIFASSGGAGYGEQDYFPADEAHPVHPLSPYGINKITCEHYIYYYASLFDLNWVALRYANVYGPRQNSKGEAGVIAIFIDQLLKGQQPIINGSGDQTRDYVYVADVVAGNKLALNETTQGIYNVGTGVESSVNDIASMLMSHFNDANIAHGPAKKGEQMRSALSAKRIQDELGWSVTCRLGEGIGHTVNWFKTENKNKSSQ